MALAGACLVAIAPFFWWGSPSGHDFEFHMFSWMEVLGKWKHGTAYPRWAALAHWGYGEARFLFYPPASWTLGAALGAVLPWKMVPGAYCWIALVLAGAAMYSLARHWLPAPDALFAAVFYALNPYHLLIVYWRSAYAELLAAALLPLLLLCLLRLSLLRPNEPGVRPILGLSLTLAAAWLTNLPAAVIIHYSAAGLALVLVVGGTARERAWTPQTRRFLIRTAMAILLGAGLASFYLVPAVYEQRWIDLSQVLSPGVRPQDNFLFTPTADPAHNRFNLLVSSIALAEIGVLAFAMWFSRRKKRLPRSRSARLDGRGRLSLSADQSPWILMAAWGTGSSILMLSMSNLLWQHLPKLRFVQLPFRWLLCMNAALAVLLTMAAKRWTSRWLLSVALLAALIFAGYRIQPPWWNTASDIREMSDAIADSTGYEGTDEYVPAGADPYELNKNFPLVSDDTGAPVQSEILAWGAVEKHFAVHASKRENLELRLLNYPAWQVKVNGKPTEPQKTDVTGLMVIPVAAGDSDVYIYFRPTMDRFAGNLVSLISLGLLIGAWIKTQPKLQSGAEDVIPCAPTVGPKKPITPGGHGRTQGKAIESVQDAASNTDSHLEPRQASRFCRSRRALWHHDRQHSELFFFAPGGRRRCHFRGERAQESGVLQSGGSRRVGSCRRLRPGDRCAWRSTGCSLRSLCRRRTAGGREQHG